MEIILDVREKKLYENCFKLINENDKFKDIQLSVINLPLADVIIKYNNEENILIERKTISDLNSSINDGRYEEQTFRFNKLNYQNHNIVYLIEGDLRKSLITEKQKLYSSIVSLFYFKGFSILRSFDIQETAYILCNLLLKIKIEYDKGNKLPYYKNDYLKSEVISETLNEVNIEINSEIINSEINTNKNIYSIKEDEETNETNDINKSNQEKENYCSIVHKSKKSSNITTENITEIMLSQIPNVSHITASVIVKKYNNIYNLIEELKKNKNCLNDITYETNNKLRKISKLSIQNIIKFLQV